MELPRERQTVPVPRNISDATDTLGIGFAFAQKATLQFDAPSLQLAAMTSAVRELEDQSGFWAPARSGMHAAHRRMPAVKSVDGQGVYLDRWGLAIGLVVAPMSRPRLVLLCCR